MFGASIGYPTSINPNMIVDFDNLFLTRAESDGKIVQPLDLQLGLFQTVVRGLLLPYGLLCGTDQHLYVDDHFFDERFGAQLTHRILRFRRDGSGRREIMRWVFGLEQGSGSIDPVMTPNGDLYLKSSTGTWRIHNVAHPNDSFGDPEQVWTNEQFRPGTPHQMLAHLSSGPLAIVQGGPHSGDLLIQVRWRYPDNKSTARDESADLFSRVLRAVGPDYMKIEEFIAPMKNVNLADAATNSRGEVFLTDFGEYEDSYQTGQILRFDADGTFINVFAELPSPNQIAVGRNDEVYVTNAVWMHGARRGGLFVYDGYGNALESADFPIDLRGVAVCQ